MDAKRLPRRLLLAAAAVPVCAAVILLLLWLNPNQAYIYEARTVSQKEAVKTCPFALITQEEFDLAAQLLANENVTAFYPNPGEVDPPAHELPVGLVDASVLQIDGQDVRVTSLSVIGLAVYVDYSTPAPDDRTPRSRCILTITYDGGVSKTSARYENGEALYTVENTGNAAFTLYQHRRDLLYFLHD